MHIDRPVVGVDVAKESSHYCVLSPSGSVHIKPFERSNYAKGLASVLVTLKKVEETFGSWPILVIESTGHYSSRLIHFFIRNNLEVFLINPIQSHSIKNSGIRKAKTDKMDCEELARLPFMLKLRRFEPGSNDLANLQILCRTLHHLSEQKVVTENQLAACLDQIWPGFTRVFKNVSAKTALEFLSIYHSPAMLLTAPQDDVIALIRDSSRRGQAFARKKHELLRETAREAEMIGIRLEAVATCVNIYVGNLKHIKDQMDKLKAAINDLTIKIPEIALLKSIPGLGDNLAPMIAAEIGGISRFSKSKQLVAYCGVDPSVRQSGNFIGTHNKVTKRGSPYLRRAIYIAAVVAVRQDAKGKCVNPVLNDYYQQKIRSKPKKQALGAVMNKLLRIIFSVLKNQKPFVLITAEEQKALYRQEQLKVA